MRFEGEGVMHDDAQETSMRLAAFEHVRRLGEVHDHLTANELRPGFEFNGERIPLINPQRGIFKPQQMRFLLSIKTVFPKPVGKVWYDDQREVHRQIARADRDGSIAAFFNPDLSPPERTLAQMEGWILGAADASHRPVRAKTTSSVKSLRTPREVGTWTMHTCPECGYAFRGGTWGGVDAHWKAFHDEIMSYREAWPIIRAGGKPSTKIAR
jgi:hypothetical protein